MELLEREDVITKKWIEKQKKDQVINIFVIIHSISLTYNCKLWIIVTKIFDWKED